MKYPFKPIPPITHTVKVVLLLALLSYGPTPTQAQEHTPAPRALKAGEQVPDIVLPHVLHHPAGQARLLDFRGRLLILQFWSTTCGSSLAALPQLEALQQAFGDNLRIVTATTQKRETVETFLAKNPIGQRMTLPIVVESKFLQEFFPYNAVPHLAWISPDGELIAQTGPYDATPETVRRLLRGQDGNFKDHKKDILDYNFREPLFLDGNGGSPFPLYRSILTPYVAGLGGGSGRVKTDSTLRLHFINLSVPQLFRAACGLPSYFPEKQVALASDKARTHQVRDWVLERQLKNFCYELLLPADQAGSAHAYMRQDLERLFGLRASIQKRRTDCWELILTDRASVPLSKGGAPLHNFTDVADPNKYMRNESISRLLVFLNQHLPDLPVLDKTGITRPIDLQLSEEDLQDTDRLNARLATYGLQLKKKRRPLDILVIQ